VALDGPTVSIDVAPLGPAGRYEIGYRIISADGHPVTGSVAP
jgi:copper resistance protein C